MKAAHQTKSLVLVAATLALAAPPPALAGKGGKPGGGGGEEPPAVELVPAPVEYRVTLIDYNPETLTWLEDVNAAGVAVGYQYFSNQNATGWMADAQGNQWDLSEYFSGALTAYPGWRVGYALEINKAGQVACILVPNDHDRSTGPYPSAIVALGEIYAEPPTLTTVDQFDDPSGWVIEDLNEEGDVLIEQADRGPLYLYSYPFASLRELVPYPPAEEVFLINASLNSAGEVMYCADVTTTASRRNKSWQVTRRGAYLWDTNGGLSELGTVDGNPWSRIGISESGSAYANIGGMPQALTPLATDWEPIAPSGLMAGGASVSKELGGEEVVIPSLETSDHLVYRAGYGAFPLNVTSGLNGMAEVDLWNAQKSDSNWLIFHGISRPDATGSGYICGRVDPQLPDGTAPGKLFILTPISVSQP